MFSARETATVSHVSQPSHRGADALTLGLVASRRRDERRLRHDGADRCRHRQLDSGWGADGITGWDYVGTVNEASAVYLGNGWVITAAHVGAGTFILTAGSNAGTYLPTGISYSVSNANGTADLTLFQVANAPSLPVLALATATPSSFLSQGAGDPVAMLGFGGASAETWGYDDVTLANQQISVTGYSYSSTDFITANGTVSNGSTTNTNDSQLVSGDSGGGDFIYNSSLGEWQLAGINEATGTGSIGEYHGKWYLASDASGLPSGSTHVQNNVDFSAMVQTSTYQSQIDAIVDAPEPPAWSLLLFLLLGLALSRRLLRPA